MNLWWALHNFLLPVEDWRSLIVLCAASVEGRKNTCWKIMNSQRNLNINFRSRDPFSQTIRAGSCCFLCHAPTLIKMRRKFIGKSRVGNWHSRAILIVGIYHCGENMRSDINLSWITVLDDVFSSSSHPKAPMWKTCVRTSCDLSKSYEQEHTCW